MKYRHAICLFAAAFVIQTTLMNVAGVLGVTPNLLLSLVAMLSFLYDDKNFGLVLGVVFGLLYDICFMEYTGVTALSFFVISIAIMLVNAVMSKEAFVSAIIVSAASTALHSLICWSVYAMMGSGAGFALMAGMLPVQIPYNMLLAAALYFSMIKRVIRHHYDRYFR